MEEPKSYPPYLDYPKPRKQMTNADRIRSMNEYRRKKQTNADRIRAMNDEELAAFLCNLRSEEAYENTCSHCVAERFCRIGHTGMIDWLQQPAEGE